LNLERELKNLQRKWSSKISIMAALDDDEAEELTKERRVLGQELTQEQELIEHLGGYHVVPILKWKMSVGLEKKFGPGECFINYGEDYQSKTIEEEEYFRLMLRLDKSMKYDPKKDPNRKF
jgi:hypothetical protein